MIISGDASGTAKFELKSPHMNVRFLICPLRMELRENYLREPRSASTGNVAISAPATRRG